MDTILSETVDVKAVDFFYHERFPESMLSLLCGNPGKGKSTATTDIAAVMSREGWPILFCGAEDDNGIVRARLEAHGADLSKIHFPASHFRLPQDQALVELLVLKHSVKLIILDPAAEYLTPKLRDDQGVRQAITPLTDMCSEHGCSVIFVDHTLKSVSNRADPLNACRGTGLPRAARSIAFFGVNPADESERAMAWVKQSYAELPHAILFAMEPYDFEDENGEVTARVAKLVLTDDQAQGVDPISLLTAKGNMDGEPNAPKRAMAAAWLTEALQNGPKMSNDVRSEGAAVGLSWSTIRRANEDVGCELHRVHALLKDGTENKALKGSKLYWRLPDGHAGLAPGANNDYPKPEGAAPDAPPTELAVTKDETVPTPEPQPEATSLSDDDIAKLLGGE